MTEPTNGPSRRDLLLGGAVGTVMAALPATASAQARDEFPNRARAMRFAGVPQPTPVVVTRAGRVQGLVEDGVQCFRGIRYGQAPVGALRFMPPQPAEPWTTVYDAADFGAPAMQLAGGTTAGHVTDFGMQMHQVFTTPSELKVMNEDCLFLNVWTPAADGRRRPVMVWFHGGGFSYGSGAQPIYHGDSLAKFGDVVVVTVNHRLNLFGYLQLGELMGPDFAASGTVGMQDLVLALRWVRDNAGAFGGDAGNVTIMGQSGGGAKVSALMAMPSAKGLFHKASIQSGPGVTLGRPGPATATARKLLAELKIKAGDIAALRAVPATELLAAVERAGISGSGSSGGGGLGPIVDGTVIPRDPFMPDAPELSADVPLMIGWCKDEWTLFTATEPWFGRMDEAELQRRVAPMGAPGQALLAAYRRAYPGYSPTYLWEQMISARVMQGSQWIAGARARKNRAATYVWMLEWETPVNDGIYKTPHCMEIPFMLHSYDKVRAFVGPGDQPRRMADQMAGAWVSFARTGRPQASGMPQWPAYRADTRPVMALNLRSRVVNDPLSEVRVALQAMPPAAMPRG